ncbi:hypothetical protein AB1Y20_014603 [Prymnesium parvum]|uniref:Centrosomal protein of 19 kDa n=1 Tax=Prymnesium parvum TaxID=97485 RepID=A0AB34ICH1_PRYPA
MAIQPRQFGVTLNPPTITLVYSVDGKLRKRTMPVRNLRSDSNAKELAQKLAEQHPNLLDPSIVSAEQLERLTAKLVQHKQIRQLKKQQEHEQRVRQALLSDESDEEAGKAAPSVPASNSHAAPDPAGSERSTRPLPEGDSLARMMPSMRTAPPSEAHALPSSRRGAPPPEEDALSSLSTQPRVATSRLAPLPREDALSSLSSVGQAPSSRRAPLPENDSLSLLTSAPTAASRHSTGSGATSASLSTSKASTEVPSQRLDPLMAPTGRGAQSGVAPLERKPPEALAELRPTVLGSSSSSTAACMSSVKDGPSDAVQTTNRRNDRHEDEIEEVEEFGQSEDDKSPHGLTMPDGEDLNKVDPEVLARKKAAMEVDFERNRLRPGDEGFTYDKRVDFDGDKESNDWDDELEDFESSEDEIGDLLRGL